MYGFGLYGVTIAFSFLILGLITGNVITYFQGFGQKYADNYISSENIKKEKDPAPRRPASWASRKMIISTSDLTPNNNSRLKEIISKLQKGTIPDNWEGELQQILGTLATGEEQQKALLLLFTLWSQDNFDEAMTRACKLGADFAYNVKKELLCQLVDVSPPNAFEYYENNREILANHDYFIGEIAKNWSKKSPEEAWRWWIALEQKTRASTLTPFFQGLDPENNVLMTDFVNRAHSELGYVPNTVIGYWANSSPESALNWVVNTEDKDSYYMEAAICGMASKDINLAEELLSSLPQNKKEFLIFQIADQIVSTQGSKAALEWTMKLVPYAQMNKVLLAPLMSWTSKDQDESKQWVQKLPASPTKDIAISVYSESIYNVEFYDDAIELITQMESSQKKEAALKDRAQKWQKQKSEDFKKWMENSTKSEALKPFTQDLQHK